MSTPVTHIAQVHESLRNWRATLLRDILNGAVIMGTFAMPPAILGSASPLFTQIYVGAYLLLLGARFIKFPHWLKSFILIGITFGLGLAGLFDTAIWGDSRTFMIAFIVFMCLLIAPNTGWYALAITLISYTIAGWLILGGHYALPSNEVNPGNLISWLSGATTVALVSAAIIQGLRLLEREFLHAEHRSTQAVESLIREQAKIEDKIRAHTHELEARMLLFSFASQLAYRFTAYTNQKDLLDTAVELIATNFGHYHTSIYLFDERGEFAYLYSASSSMGKQMQSTGYHVAVRSFGFVISGAQDSRPIVTRNISTEAGHRESVILPESRSRALLSIHAKGHIFGVLDIQSKFPDAFSPTQLEALQIAAGQLSLVIENTILNSEAKVINDQLATFSTKQSRESWKNRSTDKPSSYQYTPLGVQILTDYKPEVAQDMHTLTTAIHLRNQKLGTLRIRRREGESSWDRRDQEIIREITEQMSLALENARLLEDAQRRVAQEQEIGEITTHIGASFDIDTIMRVTAQEIGKALGDSEISVTLNPEQLKPIPNTEMRRR